MLVARIVAPRRVCGAAFFGHGRALHLRSRAFCSDRLAKLQEDILLCPDVANCKISDGVAYIVRASQASLDIKNPLRFFRSGCDEAALATYLREQHGYPEDSVPPVRFVEALPGAETRPGPFMLQHILDALFEELDSDGDGSISLREFMDFCLATKLCRSEDEIRRVFNAADKQILEAFGAKRLDVGEFKALVLDTGIVEVRAKDVKDVGGAYFIEERVLAIVLRRWFDKYDANGDGGIDLREYCRLVADYRLPFVCSASEFKRADKDGDGLIDRQEFQALLQEAKVLATGTAIARKDDLQGMQTRWRALEGSQAFLPSKRVHIASHGDAIPPKKPGAVRFVCISDTHGQHAELASRLPAGDVLLHAGDFSMCGDLGELHSFGRWLRSLPYSKKVVVAGNHDLTLDESHESHELPDIAEQARAALATAGGDTVVYLQDEEVRVEGVRIYGSPWQPAFGSWGFNLPRGPPLQEKWKSIPRGIDVLLVHGPPLGRGDRCEPGESRVGCADLLSEIQSRVQPAFCVSGHVHESYGVSFDGVTHYVNATSCNSDYECEHAPLVFDVTVH